MYFLLFLQILLIIILVIESIQFYRILFKGFAPFISSRFSVILTVLKELDLQGNEVVYELGSGSAGFLRSIEQKFKNQKLIGIEYSWWPYILSSIQIAFSGSKIKILRKNIFKVDLKEANIIYCFLNKTTMAKLSKKFTEECKQGTLIISYCFTLPNYEPEKTVKEKNNNIYFYRI